MSISESASLSLTQSVTPIIPSVSSSVIPTKVPTTASPTVTPSPDFSNAPQENSSPLSLGLIIAVPIGALLLVAALAVCYCYKRRANNFFELSDESGADIELAEVNQSLLVKIRNNEIINIDLSNRDLGDSEAEKLADAIRGNSSLASINLCNNKITNKGASFILKSLSNNKSITRIELLGNLIDDNLIVNINHILLQNQEFQNKIIKLRQLVGEIKLSNYQDHQFLVGQLNQAISQSTYALSISSIEIDTASAVMAITCITKIGANQVRQQIQISNLDVLYKISQGSKALKTTPLISQDLTSIQNLITSFTLILTQIKQAEYTKLTAEITQIESTISLSSHQVPTHLSDNIIMTDSGIFVRQGQLEFAVTASQLDLMINSAKKLKSDLSLISEHTDFLTDLSSRSQIEGGIVFGSDISSLYLEGEQEQSQRQKAIAAKKAIAANEADNILYLEFQSQFNSILRLMQLMNISNADRQLAVGESRKEKFLGFINLAMDYIPIPEEAAPYVKIGQQIIGELVGRYEQVKYEKSCVKIANLQGNGDQHIALLSESLARIIVSDKELLDKAKTDIASTENLGLARKVIDKIIHAPTLASRISENKLSNVAIAVIYLSTSLLEAIFDEEDFASQRMVTNVDLVNQLHQMLRKKLGLAPVKIEVAAMTSDHTDVSTLRKALIGELSTSKKIQQRFVESDVAPIIEESTDQASSSRSTAVAKQKPQLYAPSVEDINSIKLRGASSSKDRESEIPIEKQIDALIQSLIKLQQPQYLDIQEEIKIAFYHQLKITDPNYIKSRTIDLLIQELTQVRDNPEGDNFKEFRAVIAKTVDIKNFTLNLISNLDQKILRKFSLFKVYKECLAHDRSIDAEFASSSNQMQDERSKLTLQVAERLVSASTDELRNLNRLLGLTKVGTKKQVSGVEQTDDESDYWPLANEAAITDDVTKKPPSTSVSSAKGRGGKRRKKGRGK